MVESYKLCPICGTPNHRNATMCTTCGTSLDGVKLVSRARAGAKPDVSYDFRYGETDLAESSLATGTRSLLMGVMLGVLLMGGLGAVFLGPRLLNDPEGDTSGAAMIASPTRPPMMMATIATVTPGPSTNTPTATATITPTPTVTPTVTPCTQRVIAGDSLTGIILRCGYRNIADVMPTVMALNDIDDVTRLQIGQTVLVPWPTPTLDPALVPTATLSPTPDLGAAGLNDVNVLLAIADDDIDPFAPTPTPTLPAGVQFHTVQPDENLITIAVRYNADAKVLSELNPEIDFARCEFGERFGGPECLVQLRQGQVMRVPAPSPTPTLSPTPSGSETPTPTATATFNAPSVVSPSNRAFFNRDELVTLRWAPTGTLGPNEIYEVRVTDMTTDQSFIGRTNNLSFIVPREWQGEDRLRHEYAWTVSVINVRDPDNPIHRTEPTVFVWQGRLDATPTQESS